MPKISCSVNKTGLHCFPVVSCFTAFEAVLKRFQRVSTSASNAVKHQTVQQEVLFTEHEILGI